jgi:hypothetical protein
MGTISIILYIITPCIFTSSDADIPLRMMRSQAILNEIKASAEQVKKLDDCYRRLVEERRVERVRILDLGLSVRDMLEEMSALNAKYNTAMHKDLSDILTATQNRRFEQLEVQRMGIRAFYDPKIDKAMKLTIKQKIIRSRCFNDFVEQSGDGEASAERRKRQNEISARGVRELVDSMTPEQKNVWRQLVGNDFVFKDD